MVANSFAAATGVSLLALVAACGGSVAPESSPAKASSPLPVDGPALPPSTGQASAAPTSPPPWNPLPWGPAKACGDYNVFSMNFDGQRVLTIHVDRHALGLSTVGESTTVSVFALPSIYIERFDAALKELPYCALFPPDPLPKSEIWKPTAGTITITWTGIGREGDEFAYSFQLHGVRFVTNSSAVEVLPDLTLDGPASY
jgi:hypothetical protein